MTISVRAVFEHPATRTAEVIGRPGIVRFLTLEPRRCAMIDGEGPPEADAFAARMPGLYAAAYGIRFALKRRGIEEKVSHLEGLWSTADVFPGLDAVLAGSRARWLWTLLIALPDQANDAEIEENLLAGRRALDRPLRDSLRVETFDEGEVAQLLHIGPYSAERPSIERLHAAIAEAGLGPRGRHHEIYLGDPRRTDPGRLRTVIRQPVG